METSEPPFDRERLLTAVTARGAQRSRRRRLSPRLMALAAAALLSVGVVSAMMVLRRDALELPVPALTAGAYLESRAGESLPLEFSEGSRVLVEGSSRVRVESVDPRGARMTLVSGGMTASIVHRSDTSWVFTAGPFTVRVTGTALRIAWDPKDERFELEVTAGSVLVSGPVIEGQRRVAAGEHCRVRIPDARVDLAATKPSAELPLVSVDELPVIASSGLIPAHPAAPATPASWQALERAGRYAEAVREAERAGVDRIYAGGTADELMTLARAARLCGRGDVSRTALLRCRERFPGDARAATAAFLLGRSAGPAEAARWFSTYLSEQPNGSLAREAAGRLVEAHQQAGDVPAARAAAQRYLSLYPGGPHATFARRVLESAER